MGGSGAALLQVLVKRLGENFPNVPRLSLSTAIEFVLVRSLVDRPADHQRGLDPLLFPRGWFSGHVVLAPSSQMLGDSTTAVKNYLDATE